MSIASGRAPVDAGAFRAALRHLAGGVAIVTVTGPDGPAGLTVTSLTAASLAPPLLSFYVNHDSRSLPGLRAVDRFAVHLLDAGQHELAALFARQGADRFAPPTRWRPGPDGVPLLADVPVWLLCDRREIIPVGDHFLVVGEVVGTEVRAGGEPLLHAHGQFARSVPLNPAAVGELDFDELVAW